tara:strand:- start:71 stop:232 length:162 start_codon:yes stop_codon:yes gene_type:complete
MSLYDKYDERDYERSIQAMKNEVPNYKALLGIKYPLDKNNNKKTGKDKKDECI